MFIIILNLDIFDCLALIFLLLFLPLPKLKVIIYLLQNYYICFFFAKIIYISIYIITINIINILTIVSISFIHFTSNLIVSSINFSYITI